MLIQFSVALKAKTQSQQKKKHTVGETWFSCSNNMKIVQTITTQPLTCHIFTLKHSIQGVLYLYK